MGVGPVVCCYLRREWGEGVVGSRGCLTVAHDLDWQSKRKKRNISNLLRVHVYNYFFY